MCEGEDEEKKEEKGKDCKSVNYIKEVSEKEEDKRDE